MTVDMTAVDFAGVAPPHVSDMASGRAASPVECAMQRYAAGDTAAFAEVYQALAPRLHRFCQRLTRRRSEADDLLQDAMLRLCRARASYTHGAPVLPWAFAIARSAYLDGARRDRRRRPANPMEVDGESDVRGLTCRDSSPESDACARDLLMVVHRELGRMSAKNRTAYVLLREEELSVSEVAAVLGTTCDVVKQRVHRAYEQIRAALCNAGWDGGTT